MPYIKPKPQQLEPTTTASDYNQSPLQTEGSQVTERNKHEDKNSGSLSSPTPSGKGEYLNGSQEYTEYTLMSSEKFRYYPKTGKVYPVKGSYSSWCPEQKKTNYDDIAKKRNVAEIKKQEIQKIIKEKIEAKTYFNEGEETR